MSMITPKDPKELRPLLHRSIDQLPPEDLLLVHRVMLELERDRLVESLNADFDRDREAGRLSQVSKIIREARAALARRAADAA